MAQIFRRDSRVVLAGDGQQHPRADQLEQQSRRNRQGRPDAHDLLHRGIEVIGIAVTQPRVTLPQIASGTVVSVKAVNARGLEGWDWAKAIVGS